MPSTPQLTHEKLLQVLSLSENATAIYTSEDIIIETANNAMIAFWGKDHSVIGKPLIEAVPELKGQPFIGILQDVWNTGISYQAKDVAADLNVNGKIETFYFDFIYRAIENEQGEVECILHTATDVTEKNINRKALEEAAMKRAELVRMQAINKEFQVSQKRLHSLNDELEAMVAERTQALTESEARLRYTIEDAPVAIAVIKGMELIIETANAKMLEFWGRDTSVVGQPLLIGLPELKGQPFLELMKNVILTGVPYHANEGKAFLERNHRLEEGYYNFVCHPLRDESGKASSLMLVVNDVTEQVFARKKIEHAQELLRIATDAAELGTYYIDIQSGTFMASPRLKEFFGFKSDDDLPYDAAINQIHPDYRETVDNRIKKAIETHTKFDMEYPVIGYNDKELRWIRTVGTMQKDHTGKDQYFTGVLHNITEKKEDEIRKNDFISMVSHELKTPLTSLTAYIHLLGDLKGRNSNTLRTTVLDKANIQVKKMNRMISSFLNVARLESGKILLEKENFMLNELINAAIEETRIMAPNHIIVCENCDSVCVNADRDKIENVISNLLNNALKYTHDDKNILVSCRLHNEKAIVSVTDRGIGIAKDDIKNLFERFYRGGHNKAKGFGIGLYLSAEIIHFHHGEIWVESEISKGSTFYFSIPALQPAIENNS